MNTTKFVVGQTVRSCVNAQGMTKGVEYVVIRVCSNYMPFGEYITYMLAVDAYEGDRRSFAVDNGHLVLEAVSA